MMKKTFGALVVLGTAALIVTWITVESGSGTEGAGGPEEQKVLSNLRTNSATLHKRLAMAQERLRQSAGQIKGAQDAVHTAESIQKRKEWMEKHPVQLSGAASWEEWRPSVNSWFKVKGETDQQLESRLRQQQQGRLKGKQPGRGSSSQNRLESLRLSSSDGSGSIRLKPAFKPSVTEYSAHAPGKMAQYTVEAKASRIQSAIYVGGQPYPSSAPLRIDFQGAGLQKLRVRLTSEDGVPDCVYTVSIWKEGNKGTALADYTAQRRKVGTECQTSSDCAGGSGRVCVWGWCRCPVFYRKHGTGACSPVKKLPRWCLWPLGAMSLTTLFDVTHANTPEELSQFQGVNKPGYSRELATSKYFGGMEMKSNDVLLHSGNKLGKDLASMVNSGGSQAKVVDKDLGDPSWGIDWGVCAVVGSSARLLGSSYGDLIDDHTAVIRVGNNPVEGHEKDVGSRTSMRRQSPETAGFSEGRGDGRHGTELCVVNIRSKRWGDLRTGARCTVVELSPQFEQYMRYTWRAFQPPGANTANDISTWSADFTAVVLAMHVCGRVDVFGMDLQPEARGASYSSKAGRLSGGPNVGNPNLESRCLDQVKSLPGVFVF